MELTPEAKAASEQIVKRISEFKNMLLDMPEFKQLIADILPHVQPFMEHLNISEDILEQIREVPLEYGMLAQMGRTVVESLKEQGREEIRQKYQLEGFAALGRELVGLDQAPSTSTVSADSSVEIDADFEEA